MSPSQPAFGGGGQDAFITKLNAAGDALVYSTFLGGSLNDFARSIVVDTSGNAYLTGETRSDVDFPTVNALQPAYGGGISDAFVAKLNAAGDAVVYSTYLGGTFTDSSYGIAVDASGNAVLTGATISADFPTVSPLQPAGAGAFDGFISKLNAAGDALVYSTYFGGTSGDRGNSIAVDTAGNGYVAGSTDGAIPAAPRIDPLLGGKGDAFVAKLDAAGALVYGVSFGGSVSAETGEGIAVDAAGNAYVTGITFSTNFPTVSPVQAAHGGGARDAFAAELNAAGDALLFSTFLGGSDNFDQGWSIAVDASGNIYVTGRTSSTDFPTASALQPASGGGSDGFVVKIAPDAAGPAVTLSMTSLAFGNQVVNTTSSANQVTLTNSGSVDLNVGTLALAGTNPADFALQNDACTGAIVIPTNTCTFDVTFTPSAEGAGSATVTVPSDASSSPDQVNLDGTGVLPSAVSLSPASLTFMDQILATTSNAMQAMITNTGSADLNVGSLTLAGTNPGDFALQNDTCTGAAVTPTNSCSFEATFTPAAEGTRSATVNIPSNAASSPDSLNVTGTGVLPPAVDLSPASLTFSDQVVGSTSSAMNVTLTNTGGATLDITSIVVTADFDISTNTCGASVAGGSNCMIGVTFTPTATGALNGTLTVTDNASDSPQTVDLSGTGTDFALAVASGGSGSATLTAGGTAMYNLELDPTGFAGNVTLSCAFQGATPRGASCSVSPTSLMPNGIDPAPFTVNVMTTAQTMAAMQIGDYQSPLQAGILARHGVSLQLGLLSLLLVGLVVATLHRRPIGIRAAALLAGSMLFVLLLAACGREETAPVQTGTPAGSYSLTVTATASGVSRTTDLTLTVN